MPTPTYKPLQTIKLTSTSSSITFSNIPSTYRDLVVVGRIKSTAGNEIRVRFNGDASNIYSFVQMLGTGSSTLSNIGTTTGGWINPNYQISSSNFNVFILNIIDYSANDKNNIYLSRFNDASSNVNHLAVKWANNSVINSLNFYTLTNALAIGSSISLYGIE